MTDFMSPTNQHWSHETTTMILPDLVQSVQRTVSNKKDHQSSLKRCPNEIRPPDVTLFCYNDDELKEDTEYFLVQSLDSNKTFLRRGSVRGVKDGVKATIEHLKLQSQWKKNYEELDRGKVVIYITSLGIVRSTWDRCRHAIAILENHRINYERRDLTMCSKYVDELKNRSGQNFIDLPKIYINGSFFGGVDKLEQWSEVGELKRLLEPYKRTSGVSLCPTCYGFRFLPCTTCRGGKKSAVYCVSDELTIQLRCAQCDSCGLVPCSECSNGC
jgi:glutaredoxin domain-containing cysteine-rich protein 1